MDAKIGQLESDHRMQRRFLTGLVSDATNAVLAAPGANLRRLLRRSWFALQDWPAAALLRRLASLLNPHRTLRLAESIAA